MSELPPLKLCAHGDDDQACQLRHERIGASVPYVPVPIAPDPARDARVAARRKADSARAGRALDGLLSDAGRIVYLSAYETGWSDGYAASQLHHSGHYGVPGYCGNRVQHGAHPWSDYGVPMECLGLKSAAGGYDGPACGAAALASSVPCGRPTGHDGDHVAYLPGGSTHEWMRS